MSRPVGSVYLDAPGPSRFRPVPRGRAHTPRVATAALIATVGFLALSAAGLAVGLHTLIGEPEQAVDAIDGALDQQLVREEVEAEIVTAVREDLVGDEVSEAVAAFGIDVEAEAARVAPQLIDDPAFRAALGELVADVHRRMTVAPDPAPLDIQPLTDTVVAVTETESPALYAVLPDDTQIIDIDIADLPDVSGTMDLADRAPLLTIVGLIALGLATAVHPRRHRMIAWIARWLLAAGLATAVLAVGLPWLGGRLTGWTTIEAAVRDISLRLLAPAAMAGFVGMALVSAAAVALNRERRRVSSEGAAAALGVDEPSLMPQPTSPSLELARRGLVDTGERLTNI